MKFHVLTLFPEMISSGLNNSITGRAQEKNAISVNAVNIRDYTLDKHNSVDDYTYGGGAGMLMQAQPVYDCHKAVSGGKHIRTIYVTPQGKTFNQKIAEDLAKEEELIFLCGHYEGIDERVLSEVVTDYISIGDYVLTGGELAAMVMIDAISRLVPGVLNNDESAYTESFHNDLLEYPQYTRPEVWHDMAVPSVLLSGDHKKIESWRLEQSKLRTMERRPDLYAKYMEREKLAEALLKDRKKSKAISECISCGAGIIMNYDKKSCVVYDPFTFTLMVNASDLLFLEEFGNMIPTDCEYIVFSNEEFAKSFALKNGYVVSQLPNDFRSSGTEYTNRQNLFFVKIACN